MSLSFYQFISAGCSIIHQYFVFVVELNEYIHLTSDIKAYQRNHQLSKKNDQRRKKMKLSVILALILLGVAAFLRVDHTSLVTKQLDECKESNNTDMKA